MHRYALALLTVIACSGQNLAEFEKRVTEFRLKNGMKFIVLERHNAPVVAFNAFVNAGSAEDPDGREEMAHMFEHMIGKGTRSVGSKDWAKEEPALKKVEDVYDKLEAARKSGNEALVKTLEAELKDAIETANNWVEPNAYVRTIEEQGGVGFNAGTGFDYTTYFYSLPSNKLELWFLLSGEFFKHPVFREFYKERDVVVEERRMRVESSPQGKLLQAMLTAAFGRHPYGTFMGSVEQITSLRAKEAAAFHKKYYVPGNVTVAVVGDVDPVRVKALAEKYFGTIPPAPVPPSVQYPLAKQEKERRETIKLEAQPMLVMGYRRPNQVDKDDPVFDVIADVLSGGRTGMMYKDLVQTKKIALAAQAIPTFPGGKQSNMFVLFALPNQGKGLDELEKNIHALTEKLKTEPVDAATLQRVKTKLRAGLIRQLDSNSGLASQLPSFEVNYGDWRMLFKGLGIIEKVTAEDVQRVARQYFVPENRTVVAAEAAK